jgi:hypothetical protein
MFNLTSTWNCEFGLSGVKIKDDDWSFEFVEKSIDQKSDQRRFTYTLAAGDQNSRLNSI